MITSKPWLQTGGNLFVDAALYVTPDVVSQIEQTLVLVGSEQEAAQMRQTMTQPTAIWLDRIEAIAGGEGNNGRLGLEAQLQNALAYQASLAEEDELLPTTVVTVLNNLPGRDCTATTSNATLLPTRENFAHYKIEFIEVIAHHFEQYPSLRIVIILEPNALMDYIHGNEHADCAILLDDGIHAKALRAAAWLSWLVSQAMGDSAIAIFGFATNVAGYIPLLYQPMMPAQAMPTAAIPTAHCKGI